MTAADNVAAASVAEQQPGHASSVHLSCRALAILVHCPSLLFSSHWSVTQPLAAHSYSPDVKTLWRQPKPVHQLVQVCWTALSAAI